MIIRTPESHYSVIIIGSGPAGISIAKTLADTGHKNILIIESGMYNYNKKQNQLAKITAQGDLNSSYFQQHNLRMFGGTSAVWGGYCTVMEKGAFNNIWPIKYNDLKPYYQQAANILELPEAAWKHPFSAIKGTDELIYKPFYLSPPVRFAKKYTPYIISKQAPDILFGHTVNKIKHQHNHVTSLDISNNNGHLVTISADYYVLAGGGINTPHLLQQSNLDNSSATGKYLMDHPHCYSYGRIRLNEAIITPMLNKNKRLIHALQFSDKLCAQKNLPVFSFGLDLNLKTRRSHHDKTIEVDVTIRSEMQASNNNRVSLAQTNDWSGKAETNIDFHFNYSGQVKKAWNQLGSSLLRAGLGRVSSFSDQYEITGGGHMTGTTRMGINPENSCVNTNCRLHQLDNLYVAGSSVFSSGGAAHPTFTIVALSIRLAHHLAGKLNS